MTSHNFMKNKFGVQTDEPQKGPRGIGFLLDSNGDYDIQAKKLSNVDLATDTDDAIIYSQVFPNLSTTTIVGTTSISTPSITTTGASIAFNAKNLTGVGTSDCGAITTHGNFNLSGYDIVNLGSFTNGTNMMIVGTATLPIVVASTSVSTPSITTTGTSIALNSKNLTGIGTIGCGTITSTGYVASTREICPMYGTAGAVAVQITTNDVIRLQIPSAGFNTASSTVGLCLNDTTIEKRTLPVSFTDFPTGATLGVAGTPKIMRRQHYHYIKRQQQQLLLEALPFLQH